MSKLIWASVARRCLVGATVAAAQQVEVHRENCTVELNADSTIEMLADAVSIAVGYHYDGPTQHAAYAENMRLADQTLEGWIDLGVPENQVSTHSVSMESVSENDRRETDAERAAYAWALDKTHGIAQQMARTFWAKARARLYAANQSRANSWFTLLGVLNAESGAVASRAYERPRQITPSRFFHRKSSGTQL